MENLRPPARWGGGGVGTRSWMEDLEPTELRLRDVECLRMSALRSTPEALESEGKMIVRRTTVFWPASWCWRGRCGNSWLLRIGGLVSVDGLGE